MCPETKGRSLEGQSPDSVFSRNFAYLEHPAVIVDKPCMLTMRSDINAQFGEQVAIHLYGATEQEKKELEQAAAADEAAEYGFTSEKPRATAETIEVV
jgi:hypothetical protein